MWKLFKLPASIENLESKLSLKSNKNFVVLKQYSSTHLVYGTKDQVNKFKLGTRWQVS